MNAVKRYMRMVAQDETWEEHKAHYHHGGEPKGDCEWLDHDKGDISLEGNTTTSEIITAAKRIAKEIEHGRCVAQRVPPQAIWGIKDGGPRLAESIYVARRGETPVGVAPRNGDKGEQDKFSRLGREARSRQERDLEAYAKAENCWEEDADVRLEERFGRPAEGAESMAFFDEKNGVVEKLITDRMYSQPIENLDRIALHNWIFPDTPMEVVGFGRTKSRRSTDDNPFGLKDGMFVIHVRQPIVRIGDSADEANIDQYMSEDGFSKIPKENYWDPQRWISEDGSVVVGDLHPENAVIDTDGGFRVIDADIRLNTPRLGQGGKYVFKSLS